MQKAITRWLFDKPKIYYQYYNETSQPTNDMAFNLCTSHIMLHVTTSVIFPTRPCNPDAS